MNKLFKINQIWYIVAENMTEAHEISNSSYPTDELTEELEIEPDKISDLSIGTVSFEIMCDRDLFRIEQ